MKTNGEFFFIALVGYLPSLFKHGSNISSMTVRDYWILILKKINHFEPTFIYWSQKKENQYKNTFGKESIFFLVQWKKKNQSKKVVNFGLHGVKAQWESIK